MEKKDSGSEQLVLLVLVITVIALETFCIAKIWNWHASAIWPAAPKLTWASSVGLYALLTIFKRSDFSEEPTKTTINHVCIRTLIVIIMLGVAYAVH